MDCMQSKRFEAILAEAQEFQYRKRYGLHAMAHRDRCPRAPRCFNTASGMDCMQLVEVLSDVHSSVVSIPQAVWIACNAMTTSPLKWNGQNNRGFNTASGMDCMQWLMSSSL